MKEAIAAVWLSLME